MLLKDSHGVKIVCGIIFDGQVQMHMKKLKTFPRDKTTRNTRTTGRTAAAVEFRVLGTTTINIRPTFSLFGLRKERRRNCNYFPI